MKDEFLNENMLNILIAQKKYIEAFRIYKELIKRNMLSDPRRYSSLLTEVERIDPILTMDRATREKKAIRLSNILNRIRALKSSHHHEVEKPSFSGVAISTTLQRSEEIPHEKTPQITAPVAERATAPTMKYKGDLLGFIEEVTRQSILSVINLISGNFSQEVLSKRPKAEKIQILNSMLERIEVIKRQRQQGVI
jgi:hypothetical protein